MKIKLIVFFNTKKIRENNQLKNRAFFFGKNVSKNNSEHAL